MSRDLVGNMLLAFQADGRFLNPTETPTETTAFWIGCFLLAGGACIYGLGFRSAKREAWEDFYLNNFVICSWASCAYLAMAMHLGEWTLPATAVDAERHIYWARYCDWLVTTPIIIYDLTKLSGARPTLRRAAIFADVAMILTGIIAAFSPHDQRMVWYIVSCLFELAIFVLLLGPILATARKQHRTVSKLFTQALTFFSIFFWLYPVVWILGSKGFTLYGPAAETVLIVCLDVTAKVVYGLYLARNREKLQRLGELSELDAVSAS